MKTSPKYHSSGMPNSCPIPAPPVFSTQVITTPRAIQILSGPRRCKIYPFAQMAAFYSPSIPRLLYHLGMRLGCSRQQAVCAIRGALEFHLDAVHISEV